MLPTPEDILDFWLRQVGPNHWFSANPAFDAPLRERFSEIQAKAAAEELPQWKKTPEGMLSLILLLQEFPRRMFRNTAKAYENDFLALELARDAIIQHFDDRIDKTYKLIFYMPFVNSESMGDQRLGLFYIRERTKEDAWLTVAEKHLSIVECFGRFPDRNAALGLDSTPQEVEFLKRTSTSA